MKRFVHTSHKTFVKLFCKLTQTFLRCFKNVFLFAGIVPKLKKKILVPPVVTKETAWHTLIFSVKISVIFDTMGCHFIFVTTSGSLPDC